MDLDLFIAHIERTTDPADRAALIQRVAALAWREGWNVGYEHDITADEVPNPYREQ